MERYRNWKRNCEKKNGKILGSNYERKRGKGYLVKKKRWTRIRKKKKESRRFKNMREEENLCFI